ncbi:MAG TPA: TlpA disulfide reductase family protein [Longimicrobiales bacterium]
MKHALLLTAAALFVACGGADVERVAVGAPAPAYAAPTLDGDTVALADLRGAPVLVNVWATWCMPCREEMPELQAIQDEFGGGGLRVVGVSIDQKRAGAEIRRFIDEHAIAFMILHDPASRVAQTFRTAGVPETVLIDANGVLRARWIGQVDADDIRPALRELFAAS